MKQYRKHLVFESCVLGVLSLVLILVQVLAFNRVIRPIAGDSHWVDCWNGFVAGAGMSLMALFVIGIVINVRALRSEARLKKLFAKENDERLIQIETRAQSIGMRVSVPLMLAGGMVLGYFDVGMSLTCIACALLQSVVTVIGKVYWNRVL